MKPLSVFHWLLSLSIILFIIGFASEYLTASILPEDLREYYDEQYAWDEEETELTTEDVTLMIITIPLLSLLIAGYIGLFKLKKWGRTCFILSGILAYVGMPFLGPVVLTGISYTIYELATLCMGAIVAMSYLSPVRDHIEGSVTDQST